MIKIFLKFKLIFLCLAVLALFSAPKVLAATTYTPEIKLPNMPTSVSDPGTYVKYLFVFGLSLAGFLAVAAIAYGGVKYMLAGASIGDVQSAKDSIYGALIGIGFLLGAFLLLYTIDPTLINLSPGTLAKVTVPEPPSPADSGLTEGATTPSEGTEIKCKTAKICSDIQGGTMNSTLIKDLSSLPVEVTVTETTGSHGCSSSDSCVSGATCGTSTHCSGRAADIRISNLSDAQKQEVLKTLSQDKCVNELFYAGYPEYCRASGGQTASKSTSCSSHTDHIHYSVKSGCS